MTNERVPMFDDLVGDFHLHVYYNTKKQFEIEVTKVSTNQTKMTAIRSTYEPLFGIDQIDMYEILANAEALCEEFETEIEV